MMLKRTKCNDGFTLIEAILASVILCISVLAIGAISTRSLSDTELNIQYDKAVELIDKQLTIIDFMGVAEFIKLGRTNGRFDGSEPVCSWKAAISETDIDGLYELNMTVSWVEKGKRHSVSAATRYLAEGGFIGTE